MEQSGAVSANAVAESKGIIKPKLGPMNRGDDDHPLPVRAACRALGVPLPFWARCAKQPSKYINTGSLDGSLEQIEKILKAQNRFPEIESDLLEESYRKFKRKFKAQKNLKFTNRDLAVYFTDWLLFARPKGFTTSCYFEFELYRKEPGIRDTFLNEGYRTRVHKACATRSHLPIFLDKAKFNSKFSKYVKRDWVDTSTCTFSEFEAFAKRNERFFGKPVRGTGGAGARCVRVSESDNLLELFDECKKEGLICEEVIKQHESLAEFNADTLNTVRLITLLCADGKPRIVLTLARFGRQGSCIDNFHGGGVGAIVDIETGQITSEAINMKHERVPYHLDSNKMILGFVYPEWEKVKTAVLDAATMVPEMRNVGWDVSVCEDGHIEFVEGNGRPNYHAVQSPDQIGRKFRYEPYLREIEALNDITHVEEDPLDYGLKDESARLAKRKIWLKFFSVKKKLKRMVR